jgi:hypothetical protein
VIGSFPRGFDLVLADALYASAPFFNFPPAHGKHALTGLNDDRGNLYRDAAGLFDKIRAREGSFRKCPCLWWGFPDRLSWPQVNTPVRVIRWLGNAFGKTATRWQRRFANQRLALADYPSGRACLHRACRRFRSSAMAFLAFNIFHAFFALNLRAGDSQGQNPGVLVLVYGGGDMCRNQPRHLAMNPPPECSDPPAG